MKTPSINTLNKNFRVFLFAKMKKRFAIIIYLLFAISSVNGQKSPLEILTEYYNYDTIGDNAGKKFALNDMKAWFPQAVWDYLKNRNKIFWPETLDTSNAVNRKFIAEVEKMKTMSPKNEWHNYIPGLKSLISNIPFSKEKVWCEFEVGKILCEIDVGYKNYYFIRDSIARANKVSIEFLKTDYEKSNFYEYLGDFFYFFESFDSSVYYYRKAQTQIKNNSNLFTNYITSKHKTFYYSSIYANLESKIADIYRRLDVSDNFINVTSHSYAASLYQRVNNSSKYYLAAAKSQFDLYRTLKAFQKREIAYKPPPEGSEEGILNYIINNMLHQGSTLEEMAILHALAGEILWDNKKKKQAITALRYSLYWSLLDNTTPSRRMVSLLNVIKYYSGFSELNYKYYFDSVCKNIFELQRDKIDNCYLYLYNDQIEKAKKEINNISLNSFDSLLNPPNYLELHEYWVTCKAAIFNAEKRNIDSIYGYNEMKSHYLIMHNQNLSGIKNAELVALIDEGIEFTEKYKFQEKETRRYLQLAIAGGTLLLIAFYIIFRTEIQRTRLKLEAKATQASLNPHFIRNLTSHLSIAINSLETEKEKNLFFNSLHNLVANAYSLIEQKTVLLSEEIKNVDFLIEFYNIYKFKKSPVFFDSNKVDKQIANNLKVPPFLLFNMVENSLTKGFFEASFEKIITIQTIQNEDNLEIEIFDNGVWVPGNTQTDRTTGTTKVKNLINYYNKTEPIKIKLMPPIIEPENGTFVKYIFSGHGNV